jgi:uncharacterized protein
MTFAADPSLLIGVVVLGCVVGLLAGLFGIGGGFLLTPLLAVVFDVPMPIAVGTGLCLMVGTATSAVLRHRRLGQGEWRFDALMVGGAVVGVLLGSRVVAYLEQMGQVEFGVASIPAVRLALSIVYLAFLAFTVATLFQRRTRQSKGQRTRHGNSRSAQAGESAARVNALVTEPATTTEALAFVRRGPLARIQIPPLVNLPSIPLSRVSAPIIAYVGLGMGFLSGLLGIGGGIALMPVMLYGFGFPLRQAAGTGIFVLLTSALVGTVIYAAEGNVDLRLAMALLVGSTVFAQIGAHLTHRLPVSFLRRGLAGIIIATIAVLAWDLVARYSGTAIQ